MITAAFQNLRRRLWTPSVLAPLALALIGALGLIFRLSDLAARDLWTDEAWVALAALKASPGAALAAGQSTPPFYLLTVWAAAKILGGQEWVLRSLSFAFGVGTLVVSWLLARTLTSRRVSLLALAVVACSPIMVYYSKELKQYSGDAFFAVLAFYLAERLRASDGRRGWTALALTGLIGLGFSHTLVFCLPAAGLILWLSLPAARGRLALLGGLWLLAFGTYYFLFFRHSLDPELVAYWSLGLSGFLGAGTVFSLAGGRSVPLLLVFLWRVGAILGSALFAGRNLRPVAERPVPGPGLLGAPHPPGLRRRGAAPLPLYGALRRQPPDALQRPHVLPDGDCRSLPDFFLAVAATPALAGRGLGRGPAHLSEPVGPARRKPPPHHEPGGDQSPDRPPGTGTAAPGLGLCLLLRPMAL